jgi:hypothetical protein
MTIIWVAAPCSLVKLAVGTHRPDDEGSRYLWNASKRPRDYKAQQPKRQPHSYPPPSEPEISLRFNQVFAGHLRRSKRIPWQYHSDTITLSFNISTAENQISTFSLFSPVLHIPRPSISCSNLYTSSLYMIISAVQYMKSFILRLEIYIHETFEISE